MMISSPVERRLRRAAAPYVDQARRDRIAQSRDVELIDAIAALAAAKHELGDQSAALALANRAYMAIQRSSGEVARRLRIKLLGIIGNAHRALGDYPRAAPVLRRTLAMARKLGRDSEAAGTAMNDLGILYKYTGQFARAEALYRASLRIMQQRGEANSEVATLYHNLGGLEFSRCRYQPAVHWGRAALSLRKGLFGAGDVRVAADAAALAASLDGLGKHAEAQRLYHRALVTFRQCYGSCHYEIAVNLNNLAASLYAQGKLTEAAAYYREALAMKQKLLGASHIDVALTANNLGILYFKRRRYRLAAELISRARQILVRALGPRHPKSRAVTAAWDKVRVAARA